MSAGEYWMPDGGCHRASPARTRWRGMKIVSDLRPLQRSFHPLRRERHTAEPHAGGVKHGVADRRGTETERHFGGAGGRGFGALDQHDLDVLRNRIDVQHRIGEPVDALYHVLVEPHFLDHRPAGAVDKLPVDDMLERLRVDDHADVMRADVAGDVDLAGPAVDPYLGDQTDERGEMPPECNAAADGDVTVLLIVARRRTLLPAVVVGRDPHRVSVARVL